MANELSNAHPHWKLNIERWQFLIDSYLGGAEYKDGEYLTAYMFENREAYESRLDNTPLDNHVKAVVAIYNSFLFRQPPRRDFGSIGNDVSLEFFLQDTDLDGRNFDAVMRDVSSYSSIYGHCWAVIDKPMSSAFTRAEELSQNIRPYMSIFTPENVVDWKYTRSINGAYYLTYFKVFEGGTKDSDVYRVYTPEVIQVVEVDKSSAKEDARIVEEIPNELGMVPAVCVYSQRSPVKGVGISDVGDVADMQRAIYNELSEIEQLIRISNHPSLVKTAGTQASAGAGSIVQMPDDMPGDLKPFLLEPKGSGIEGLLNSVNQKIQAIDRMSHMGGIRSIESRRLSGVALATEFQLLNARLAEKADNLEHAEEQIWRIYARWQGLVWNGEVKYPDSFNIQDKYNDMNMLKLAKEAGVENTALNAEIERQMGRIITDSDEEYDVLLADMEAPKKDMLVHVPVTNQDDLVMHLREMVENGYTNEEILALHPELEALFNNAE